MSTEPYNSPNPGHDHDPEVGLETPTIGSDSGQTKGHAGTTSGFGDPGTASGPDLRYGTAESGPRDAAEGASSVADVAAQGATDVKDTALEKASQSKDVLLDRGADVVAVARDEAGDLAREAQAHLKSLWSQAAGQFQEQAAMAQKQVADLLHDLAGELGEMASKSEQRGPVTSLARQAATRGGALSHWLTNAETTDVLVEVKRLARKRPMAFLAGAAVAGVLVGRLGRGLMARDDSIAAPHSDPSVGASTTHAAPSRAGAVGGHGLASPGAGSVYATNISATGQATPYGDGSVEDTDLVAGEPFDGGSR